MKRILIVDDEPITLKFVQQHLSSEGYEITTAIDGFNALKEIEKNKFDLIISDIMMPNLSGLTLLSMTKEFHHEIAVIFISSLNKEEIFAKSVELGVDDFMVKPIDLGELSIKIDRLLQK